MLTTLYIILVFLFIMRGLRKPTSPPLPLREGPPLISVFSPQGRRGNRSSSSLWTISFYGWRTIRGLRQQRICSFLCGDEPAFTQGFAKGLLARCFFRKPTRSSFIDKAGCTRQFESELSLRSFAQPFPSGDKGCTNRPFNSLYDPFGSPCRGQKRSSNRYAIRLADHQRSTPAAELRFFVRDGTALLKSCSWERRDTNRGLLLWGRREMTSC